VAISAPAPPPTKAPEFLRARYVAIIADGSRRWAHARGLSLADGQQAATDTVKARVLDALELGIEQLTIYAFSTENWSRSPTEVSSLTALLARRIAAETGELHARGVRVRFLGRRDGTPLPLIRAREAAERLTRANVAMTLFIAFNYGGRAELLDAFARFQGGDEEDFRACLYAPDLRDPDLIVRTSGERRLSNFLLWQSAYSELVFRDELWPDFTRAGLEDSLAEFAARRRRFGGR
jgi:undecaprenyl diphosphate synthase